MKPPEIEFVSKHSAYIYECAYNYMRKELRVAYILLPENGLCQYIDYECTIRLPEENVDLTSKSFFYKGLYPKSTFFRFFDKIRETYFFELNSIPLQRKVNPFSSTLVYFGAKVLNGSENLICLPGGQHLDHKDFFRIGRLFSSALPAACSVERNKELYFEKIEF